MSNDKNISEQIEALILQADNPKDKAFLLIMNKIADSLDENTDTTRELKEELKLHRREFQEHEGKEMALINQGRGFLRAALAALAVFQALFAWYASRHISNMDGLGVRVQVVEREVDIHKEHHRQEERFRGGPAVK